GLPAGDQTQAASLSRTTALQDPRRRGARRSATDLVSARRWTADDVRARGQDTRAGGLDRACALFGARPGRADGGGLARGDARRRRAEPRAEPTLFVGVHAVRATRSLAPAHRPARERV